MKIMRMISLWLVLMMLLSACTAGRRAFDDGQQKIRVGNTEAGLAALEKAQQQNADNLEYKSNYLRQKELYIRQLLRKGDVERAAKKYADADSHLSERIPVRPRTTSTPATALPASVMTAAMTT